MHLQGDQLSKCKACGPSGVQRLDTDLAIYHVFTGAHSPVPLLEGVHSLVNHDEQMFIDARLFVPTQDPDLVQARETATVLPYREILAAPCTPCPSTSRCESTRCAFVIMNVVALNVVALTFLSGSCSS